MDDQSRHRRPKGLRARGQQAQRLRKVMVGKREVLTSGLAPSFWNDVYFSAMTATWPGFLGSLAATFVLLNGCFAFLYSLVPDSVANTGGRLENLFFFSVETLTTVGYGEFFPQSIYGHIVVSVETFAGLFFTASMLGLIFARLSRPRARLLFAKNLIVGPYEGRRTLFARVANERLNVISSANARLWMLISEVTAEGVRFRRFAELKLLRSENPSFVLSWTVLHVIDEASPLHGKTAKELAEQDAFFILNVTGQDDTSMQTVQSRETYGAADLRWDHRFVDILSVTEDGMNLLDYDLLHAIEPIATAVDQEGR